MKITALAVLVLAFGALSAFASDEVFRHTRSDTSVFDMSQQLATARTQILSLLDQATQATLIKVSAAGTDAEAKIRTLQTDVTTRFADINKKISDAAQAVNNVISRAEIQAKLTRELGNSDTNQVLKIGQDISEARRAFAITMTEQMAAYDQLVVQVEATLASILQSMETDVASVNTAYDAANRDIQSRVDASLAQLRTREDQAILKVRPPVVTDSSKENQPCLASEKGKIFVSKPGFVTPRDIQPGGAEDELRGRAYSLESRSHGSGYSVKFHEIWNPEWSGTTIYRYDATTYAPKGTFNVARSSIMQCAGDEQGFFYGAHWGQSVICKAGPFPNMQSEQWCYGIGDTAAGVTVDTQYVYGTRHYGSQIYVINKVTGNLFRTISMQSWPGSYSYGHAQYGNRFWWLYSNYAVEYRLSDGARMRDFPLVTSPNAVFTDGEKFCLSPNSNQFFCYRISSSSPYVTVAPRLYYCTGSVNKQVL